MKVLKKPMSFKIGWLDNSYRKVAKKRGGKNEGKSHYVIENKWRKNVRKRPLHYVIEK